MSFIVTVVPLPFQLSPLLHEVYSRDIVVSPIFLSLRFIIDESDHRVRDSLVRPNICMSSPDIGAHSLDRSGELSHRMCRLTTMNEDSTHSKFHWGDLG